MTNGEVFTAALMVNMISDVVMFLNVGKSMNEDQVKTTASMIIKDFNFLRVEDFKLCFDNLKKGKYGKQYDRLDGQVFFNALDIYVNDRADEAERLSINRHIEIEANKNNDVNSEGQKKVIEILKEANKLSIKKESIKNKALVKSERDLFIQKCFNEFESIHKNKPLKTNNGTFIMHNSDPVDQVEFVTIKLKEYDKQTSLNGDKK